MYIIPYRNPSRWLFINLVSKEVYWDLTDPVTELATALYTELLVICLNEVHSTAKETTYVEVQVHM
jgi:hypothetical protein